METPALRAEGFSSAPARRTRRVFYRLPEVLQATSLIACEGEKGCETARKLGLVATTNAGGAHAKWLDEYSEALRAKRVAIIADADDALSRNFW